MNRSLLIFFISQKQFYSLNFIFPLLEATMQLRAVRLPVEKGMCLSIIKRALPSSSRFSCTYDATIDDKRRRNRPFHDEDRLPRCKILVTSSLILRAEPAIAL